MAEAALDVGPPVGEEADVEIFGGVDQLFDGTALALRVAEEELGDALLMRELEQGVGEIAALQAMHFRADFAREGEVLVETGAVRGVQVGLFDVGGEQGAVEAAGVALAAFEHGAGVAARREADEDALLGAPTDRNAVRIQVFLQLAVDDVGGEQQGQFAEFGEHARVAHGDVGRRIDDFDFVGFVQELFGDAGGGAFSGQALDGGLLLADVLQVDGGDDGDALVQDLLDILPALRVAAAGRIVEGQLIDQADLRGGGGRWRAGRWRHRRRG